MITQNAITTLVLSSLLLATVPGCDALWTEDFADGNVYTDKSDRLRTSADYRWVEFGGNTTFSAMPYRVVVADLDANGRDELIVEYGKLGVIQVGAIYKQNEQDGELFHWQNVVPALEFAAGDVDPTSAGEELVVAEQSGMLLFEDPTRKRQFKIYTLSLAGEGHHVLKLVGTHDLPCSELLGLADADGDGLDDWFCRVTAQGLDHTKVHVLLSPAGQQQASDLVATQIPTSRTVGESQIEHDRITRFFVSDHDGDGKNDVVARVNHGEGPDSIAVCYGDGEGSFGKPVTLLKAPVRVDGDNSWWTLDFDRGGDFNGDGRADLMLRLFDDSHRNRRVPRTPRILWGKPRTARVSLTELPHVNLQELPASHPFVGDFTEAIETDYYYKDFQIAADLDGDGVEDVVQLGCDEDICSPLGVGPRFIRILQGSKAGAAASALSYQSNTRLEDPVPQGSRWVQPGGNFGNPWLERFVVKGRFLGNDRDQILVGDRLTLGWSIFSYQ
jgi:hypothetical protein